MSLLHRTVPLASELPLISTSCNSLPLAAYFPVEARMPALKSRVIWSLSRLKNPLVSMLLKPVLVAVLKPDAPPPNLFPPNLELTLELTPRVPNVVGRNRGVVSRGNVTGRKLKLKLGTRGTENGRNVPRFPTPLNVPLLKVPGLLKVPALLKVCPVPVVKEVVEGLLLLKRVLVVKAVPLPPGPPADAEDVVKVAHVPRPTHASSSVRCRMDAIAVDRRRRVSLRRQVLTAGRRQGCH